MSFTDEIVPSIVFQHILRKQRFGIKSHNAGFEAMVSGLNIAVTVIDSYDQFFFELFHSKYLLSPRLSGVSI